jgi:xylan 1,4-beta-xylosidase
MGYRNPVIAGFYPDPSVCRVGRDYYLVTSSFECFPGVPLFHSRDLVNWRQIGHCLTRESQLPLDRCSASGGIWAPTIRHHRGTFYMTTTLVPPGRPVSNFYVTAPDPAGPWSEPLFVDQGGIDPSFFFDDDGTVYYTTNHGFPEYPHGVISMAAIDIATGKRLSDVKPIWPGTGGIAPEGPHLYKINGVYYLMIAEGGTHYGHMETIARSERPWGPWEPCPHNPILTHRDDHMSPIQCTGHADLIQAHDGSWWLVHLGVRPAFYQKQYLGRETYLTPVAWDANGWPVVGGGTGMTGLEMEVPTLPLQPWPEDDPRDDFDGPEPRLCWNHLRNPRRDCYSLTERPGWLRLRGTELTLDDVASPTFLGRRQQHHTMRASALLDFEPTHDGDEAGLTALMNPEHHYEVAVLRDRGTPSAIVRRRIGDLTVVVARRPLTPGPVVLQIAGEKERYAFGCGTPGGEVSPLATASTRYLAAEVADTFTGVYLGMYATGNGRASSAPADFDWFEYLGSD